MQPHMSPAHQPSRHYPEAADYSKKYPRRYHARGLMTVLALVFMGMVTLAFVAVWGFFGSPNPSIVLREGNSGIVLFVAIFVVSVCLVTPMFGAFLGAAIFIYNNVKTAKTLADALDQNGVVTQGTIVDHWSARVSVGEGEVWAYYVAYQYGGGTVMQELARAVHQHYTIGMPVRVRYLPNNMLVARLEDHS